MRIGQLRPKNEANRRIKVTGTNKYIPDRRAEEIGVPARKFIDKGGSFVILVDDLEKYFVTTRDTVFRLYREALDVMLKGRTHLASVHFLVNMLEAYYFADARAINHVLGTQLQDHPGDVEEIGHPKNELKQLVEGFDEVEHGQEILAILDVEHVLSRPETCASLRGLFKWCTLVMGLQPSARYSLVNGAVEATTAGQLSAWEAPQSS